PDPEEPVIHRTPHDRAQGILEAPARGLSTARPRLHPRAVGRYLDLEFADRLRLVEALGDHGTNTNGPEVVEGEDGHARVGYVFEHLVAARLRDLARA